MLTASQPEFSRPKWQTIVVASLFFWLSSSLILDLVIMPSLYATGMMTQTGFATAGYSIFWIFNRIEVLCAAFTLTGVLLLHQTQASLGTQGTQGAQPGMRRAIALSTALLAIALIYTYALTPTMSALGLHLNLFESAAVVPVAMDQMHQSYWILEVAKLVAGGTLLSLLYRSQDSASSVS